MPLTFIYLKRFHVLLMAYRNIYILRNTKSTKIQLNCKEICLIGTEIVCLLGSINCFEYFINFNLEKSASICLRFKIVVSILTEI